MSLLEQVDSLAGALIADRYRLGRRIARGAMGAVFEAEQVVLGRKVAIKIHDPDAKHSEKEASQGSGAYSVGSTDRFLREAGSAAMLNHPNIAVIYEYGEWQPAGLDHPLHFIAMEFVDGMTLSDYAGKKKAVSFDVAADLISQLLEGLVEAHSHGIVHRDLKPANVLVTKKGRVKIVDFGLAKSLNAPEAFRTQIGLVLGTPSYMSPEQILGRDLTVQTDLYSATCLFARLLTGKAPYKGETSIETMSMHLSGDLPEFADLRPEDRKLLWRGLAKASEDRWESAEQFLEAIAMAREIDPTLNTKALVAPPSRTPLFGAIVLLLFIIGVGAFFMTMGTQPEGAVDPDAVPLPTPEVQIVEEPVEVVEEPVAQLVNLTSAPSGATVFDGTTELCTTPCELQWDEPKDLVVKLKGYQDKNYALSEHGKHDVELEKQKATRKRPAPVRPKPAPKPESSTTPKPVNEPTPAPVKPDPTSDEFKMDEIKNPFE